jgi:hypothetical protein
MTMRSKRVPPKDWPYEDADPFDVPIKEPSWECPDGTCACHPVEEGEPRELTILLLDELGRAIPRARCRVLYQDRVLNEDQPNANDEGWLSVTVTRRVRVVTLEWAPPDTPLGRRFPFRKRYFVDLKEHEDDHRSLARRSRRRSGCT